MNQNLPMLTTDVSRKDVMRLQHAATAQLFFRFRDFVGATRSTAQRRPRGPRMMLRWDIVPGPVVTPSRSRDHRQAQRPHHAKNQPAPALSTKRWTNVSAREQIHRRYFPRSR